MSILKSIIFSSFLVITNALNQTNTISKDNQDPQDESNSTAQIIFYSVGIIILISCMSVAIVKAVRKELKKNRVSDQNSSTSVLARRRELSLSQANSLATKQRAIISSPSQPPFVARADAFDPESQEVPMSLDSSINATRRAAQKTFNSADRPKTRRKDPVASMVSNPLEFSPQERAGSSTDLSHSLDPKPLPGVPRITIE